MYNSHTTKEGFHMQICDLSDNDLLEIINSILENIRVIKNTMRSKDANSYDPFKKKLGDNSRLSMLDLEQNLDLVMTKMHPYISEAALRGLDIKNQMQDVFERGGQPKHNEIVGIKQLITTILNNIRSKPGDNKLLE